MCLGRSGVSNMTERVLLFSNATEYDDWVSNNCHKCSKHRPEAEYCDEFVCNIDHAIVQSAVDDGCVDKEIAIHTLRFCFLSITQNRQTCFIKSARLGRSIIHW